MRMARVAARQLALLPWIQEPICGNAPLADTRDGGTGKQAKTTGESGHPSHKLVRGGVQRLT